MSSKAAKKPTPSAAFPTKSYIHEQNLTTGQHRIVIFENGVPQASQWFEWRDVAHFHDLHASNGAQGLPKGIFRTVSVNHQAMGA